MLSIKLGVIASGMFILGFGVVCQSIILVVIGVAACISVLFYDD